jgi:hypothetical protein
VSGGDGPGPESAAVAVADGAGIGRAPRGVLGQEVADDPAELVRQVDRLEGNPESGCNHARIARVSYGAAGLLLDLRFLDMDPVAHEQADQVVALPGQQPGGHRAVDPAAHGDDGASRAGLRWEIHGSDGFREGRE